MTYPTAFRRSVLTLGAALAIAYLSSCGRTTYVGDHQKNQGPEIFVELEPNDTPDFPDFVAVLNRQSYLVVEGTVDAVGFDIVDHIEFESSEPIEIDFSLLSLDPLGDVDVTIYDPISGEILGVYALAGDIETGTIVVHEAGRPFQFIIEAYDRTTDWDLELIAYPYDPFFFSSVAPEADLDSAPEDAPSRTSWIEVRGTGTDPIKEIASDLD